MVVEEVPVTAETVQAPDLPVQDSIYELEDDEDEGES